MTVRRSLGPIALALLVVAVGVAVFVSARDAARRRAELAVVTVHGLIGSEKEAYLRDPRVLAVLRRNGVDLKVETSGSRAMSERADLKQWDFAFPAGAPAAQRLKQIVGNSELSTPFFTPMTVASWKPIAHILAANGIVRREAGHYYIVDMPALLAAETSGKRWRDLKNASAYPVNKSILISSTDPRSSNSGAMYAALASYVLNGNQVVDGHAQIARIQPRIDGLFLRQGYQESSSAGPFEDYVQIGMGKAPLVMIYEAQFIEFELANGGPRDDMVLLYPKPTIFAKHTFVPITERGAKVGRLLTTDPELQHLAVEHGFRIQDVAFTRTYWNSRHVAVPDQLIDVVDPPSYEFLEAMLVGIEHAYATNQ